MHATTDARDSFKHYAIVSEILGSLGININSLEGKFGVSLELSGSVGFASVLRITPHVHVLIFV